MVGDDMEALPQGSVLFLRRVKFAAACPDQVFC